MSTEISRYGIQLNSLGVTGVRLRGRSLTLDNPNADFGLRNVSAAAEGQGLTLDNPYVECGPDPEFRMARQRLGYTP